MSADFASRCVETQRREVREADFIDDASDAVLHELHIPVQEETEAAAAGLQVGESLSSVDWQEPIDSFL
jgi:hypothetical protein